MRELPRRGGPARRLAVVALAAAMAVLPGCASIKRAVVLEKPPPRVSVKGYQLELAYGKDPAPPPAEPGVTTVVDTFEGFLGETFEDFVVEDFRPPTRRRTIGGGPVEPCPPPSPSVVAERPITPDVKVAPEAGVYRWQNKGSLEFVGLLKTSLDGLSSRTVRNVRQVPSTGTGAVPPSGGVDPNRRATLFDVDSSAGTLRFTHSFRVEPGQGIFLAGLRTTSASGTSTFTPAVPVKIFTLPAVENTEVADVGVDPLTGTALVVQGRILRKERIEGCDELVDGWFVDATWTFITPGQLPQAWDYDYTVATQHGGLIVGDALKATQTVGPLLVRIDATSAFGSITPRAAS